MQLGTIGLGRMGASMAQRLMRGGHECVGYDVHVEAVRTLTVHGATGAASLEDLVDRLSRPRIVWLMVPAGAITDDSITAL